MTKSFNDRELDKEGEKKNWLNTEDGALMDLLR